MILDKVPSVSPPVKKYSCICSRCSLRLQTEGKPLHLIFRLLCFSYPYCLQFSPPIPLANFHTYFLWFFVMISNSKKLLFLIRIERKRLQIKIYKQKKSLSLFHPNSIGNPICLLICCLSEFTLQT